MVFLKIVKCAKCYNLLMKTHFVLHISVIPINNKFIHYMTNQITFNKLGFHYYIELKLKFKSKVEKTQVPQQLWLKFIKNVP